MTSIVEHSTFRSIDIIVNNELPQNYLEAVDVLEEVSREVGVPYLIVGSLGVALLRNEAWQVKRNDGSLRDIDVLWIGSNENILKAQESMVEKRSILDLKIRVDDERQFFGEFLSFGRDTARVSFKDLSVEIPISRFDPVLVGVEGRNLPVMKPELHLGLNMALNAWGVNNPLMNNHKIIRRVRSLQKIVKSFSGKNQENTENLTKLLGDFKNDVIKKYPDYFLLRSIKRWVGGMRHRGEGWLVLFLIDSFRHIKPDVWKKLHEKVEE